MKVLKVVIPAIAFLRCTLICRLDTFLILLAKAVASKSGCGLWLGPLSLRKTLCMAGRLNPLAAKSLGPVSSSRAGPDRTVCRL